MLKLITELSRVDSEGGVFHSGSSWLTILMVGVACVGFLFWLITYGIAISYGFKNNSYAIPVVAVCLNIQWEALASFQWKMPFAVWHIGCILWLLMDCFIVYQVFRYGRQQQTVPELKQAFYPLVAVGMVLALFGQLTFTKMSGDRIGIIDAYIINMVMTLLFFSLYFNRRDAGKQVYLMAWMKFIGTFVTTLSLIWLFPILYPQKASGFMLVICPAVSAFDLLYIVMLTLERRRAAMTPPETLEAGVQLEAAGQASARQSA